MREPAAKRPKIERKKITVDGQRIILSTDDEYENFCKIKRVMFLVGDDSNGKKQCFYDFESLEGGSTYSMMCLP